MSASNEESKAQSDPYDKGQPFARLDGLPPFATGVPSADGRHVTYSMDCPGGDLTLVSLPDTFLLSPTNNTACPCAIFLGSFTSTGQQIGGSVSLRQGASMIKWQKEQLQ